MNRKLRATILVVMWLSGSTMVGNSSRAYVPLEPKPMSPPVFTSTINIPPGSTFWIAPNDADTNFAGLLYDRMGFEGLLAPPYKSRQFF